MSIPDIHKDTVGSSYPKDRTLRHKEDYADDVSSAERRRRRSFEDCAE